MDKYYKFLILLLFSFALKAQEPTQLNALYTIGAASNVSGGGYEIEGTMNDLNGVYYGGLVAINDEVWDSKCDRYIITSIESTVPNLIVRVSGNILPTTGIGIVYRPTVNLNYPLITPGLPEKLNACLLNQRVIQGDTISGGGVENNTNELAAVGEGTTAQRDLLTPKQGDIWNNTDSLHTEFYDSVDGWVAELDKDVDPINITTGTTIERDALSPKQGDIHQNTDTEITEHYDGTDWVENIIKDINDERTYKVVHGIGRSATSELTASYSWNNIDTIDWKIYASSVNEQPDASGKLGGWITSATESTTGTINVSAPYGVAIGDSQVEGHPALHGTLHGGTVNVAGQVPYYLEQYTKYKCYNHGIGGETSVQVKARWDTDALGNGGTNLPQDNKPVYIYVQVGINDIATGVPIEDTKANLLFFAKSAKENNIDCVFGNIGAHSNLTAAQYLLVAELNEWMDGNSLKNYGAKVVDYNLWSQDGFYNNNEHVNESYFVDNVHPTMLGYADYATNVLIPNGDFKVLREINISAFSDGPGNFARPSSVSILGNTYVLDSEDVTLPYIGSITDDNINVQILGKTTVTGSGTYTGISAIKYTLSSLTEKPTELVEVTQLEAESGTLSEIKGYTPLRDKQAFDSFYTNSQTSTTNIDGSLNNKSFVTMTSDITYTASNIVEGQNYTLTFIGDATTDYKVTFNTTQFKYIDNTDLGTIKIKATTHHVFEFVAENGVLRWHNKHGIFEAPKQITSEKRVVSVDRFVPNYPTYKGAILTAGSGGTYATLTDAYNAASDGDVVQILSDIDLDLEAAGHLSLNTVGKGVKFIGVGDITLTSTNVTQAIRQRQSAKVMFENLTINSSGGIVFNYLSGLFVDNSALYIKDVIVNNSINQNVLFTHASASHAVTFISEDCTFNNSHATAPTMFNCNGNDLNGDVFYFQNNRIDQFGGGKILSMNPNHDYNLYMYDNEMYSVAVSAMIAVGTDNTSPISTGLGIDIRGNHIEYLDTGEGHNVLIGRGINSTIIANNTIINNSETASDIGLVIKSTNTLTTNRIVTGNYIEAYFPILIKGGSFLDLTYNYLMSKNGRGVRIENSNLSGDVRNCPNITFKYNYVKAKEFCLYLLATDVGTEDIAVTKDTWEFNYNTYYSDEDKYLGVNATHVLGFTEKIAFWTYDDISRYEYLDINRRFYLPKIDLNDYTTISYVDNLIYTPPTSGTNQPYNLLGGSTTMPATFEDGEHIIYENVSGIQNTVTLTADAGYEFTRGSYLGGLTTIDLIPGQVIEIVKDETNNIYRVVSDYRGEKLNSEGFDATGGQTVINVGKFKDYLKKDWILWVNGQKFTIGQPNSKILSVDGVAGTITLKAANALLINDEWQFEGLIR